MNVKLVYYILVIFLAGVCYLVLILLIPTYLYEKFIKKLEELFIHTATLAHSFFIRFGKIVENLFSFQHT